MKSFLFFVSSVIHVSIVDAKDYTIPSQNPVRCFKSLTTPCSLVTGDRPLMYTWKASTWELGHQVVANTKEGSTWNLYNGPLVVDTKEPLRIHTPFADIFINQAKVMVAVSDTKVRVLSLEGDGVRVKPKGEPEDQYLFPGFENWYGGVERGQANYGVASVIDFESFAKQRARFFLNHQYGFLQELSDVAQKVKRAARLASQMHQSLISRKIASVEENHQEILNKKRKDVEYNQYLRRLFLKKIRYDY